MKAKIFYIVASLVLVFSLAGAVVPAGTAIAATLCVNPGGTGGCFASIQAAINAANPAGGDTIIIAAGTYNEHDITINKSLTIQGAGAGSTFIDGQDISRVFYINNSVVDVSGMTIRNGNVTGTGDGGGLYNDGGNVTMTSCTVSDNHADDDGGGIYNDDGSVTLTNCTISGNTAGDEGGGIWTGGVIIINGTLIMTNCIISGNKADEGGGIFNSGDKVIMTSCTVSDNTARNGDGGGISTPIMDDTLEMTDCTVSGNKASRNGGGINIVEDEVTLTNCTVSGNEAGFDGAGIYNNRGTVNMTNCTISGNKAKAEYRSAHGSSYGLPFGPPTYSDGGGIYTVGDVDTVTLNYCTITDNTAEGSGGGIHNNNDTVVLTCTIVYGNTFDDNIVGGCIPDLCSIVGGADVRLGPLQNNGGPTETHALLVGSPAIDTCDCGCSVDTDQRGLPRPVDGDNDGTAVCDVGAYEKQPTVGGIIEPVDKIGVLAPWLGLVALIIVVIPVIVFLKRKRVA